MLIYRTLCRAIPCVLMLSALPASADIIPGSAFCRDDISCELTLRNTESKTYRCTVSIEAEVTNSTGRTSLIWSDQVRDILVEANQDTKARFDFSIQMREIWLTDSTYHNLSPTRGIEKSCTPVSEPPPSSIDFASAGHYEVTVQNLSCNFEPTPCNNDQCRVTVFTAGQIINANGSKPGLETGKPWLWDQNFGCWVRGSSKYMSQLAAPAASDVTLLGSGSFEITTDWLACNVTPAVCNSESCLVYKLPTGYRGQASKVFNQTNASGNTKPWLFEKDLGCYLRGSTRYLRQI